MNVPHIPVLLEAVSTLLEIKPTDFVVDATVGYGGHSQRFLDKLGPSGHLMGIDQDPTALTYCQSHLNAGQSSFSLHLSNFSALPTLLAGKKANVVLADLGVSSLQLDTPERGFSYTEEGPLDMRMNTTQSLTAAVILNTYSEEGLTELFQTYGELYRCQKLVRLILETRESRPFETRTDLITILKKAFFFRNSRSLYLKTCSQVFQALRIEVNQELAHLELFLNQLESCLTPGAKVGIISFHSLEDRMVKHFFKNHPKFRSLDPKLVRADQEEIRQNTRSKPAKLRGVEFLA